jgi:hypothetical protein
MKDYLAKILEMRNEAHTTYIGIGSSVNMEVNQLTEKTDQIVPVFIRDILAKNRSVFAIHFDPMFNLEKMKEYFDRWSENGRPKMSFNDLGYAWLFSSTNLIVVICPSAFEHKEIDRDVGSDDLFLAKLIHQTLSSGRNLILQEYTGFDTVCVLKKLFLESKDKEKFKQNILFDVSYGADCSCQTDLTRYKPFVKADGSFYNFLLYNENELLAIIGKDPGMDSLIYAYFQKKWIQVLNDNHVNYRRRLKGDLCLFSSEVYGADSDPSLIMDFLQNQLVQMMVIFHGLGLSSVKEKEFEALLEKYIEWDVYKWYSAISKIV